MDPCPLSEKLLGAIENHNPLVMKYVDEKLNHQATYQNITGY